MRRKWKSLIAKALTLIMCLNLAAVSNAVVAYAESQNQNTEISKGGGG